MRFVRWILPALVAFPIAAAAADPPSPEPAPPDTTTVGSPVAPTEVVDLTSLQHLTSVCVFVHDLDPEAEQNGLFVNQIYFNVALKLAKAGIDIIPPSQFPETENASRMDVFVRTMSPDGLNYVYNLGLSLNQPVSLLRDPQLTFGASTWRSEELGMVAIGDAPKLLDSIDERVDLFIHDYQEANP